MKIKNKKQHDNNTKQHEDLRPCLPSSLTFFLTFLFPLFPLLFFFYCHLYPYFYHIKQQSEGRGKREREGKTTCFSTLIYPKITCACYYRREKFQGKTNILKLRSFLAGERMKQTKNRKGKKQKYTYNNTHWTAQSKD